MRDSLIEQESPRLYTAQGKKVTPVLLGLQDDRNNIE